MKQRYLASASLSTVTLVLGLLSPLSAHAQMSSDKSPRVIDETLVISDPTVAEQGKWLLGGTLDAWRVNSTSKVVASIWNAEASSTFQQSGGSIFIGYDDITVNYSRRSGGEKTLLTNGAHTASGTIKVNDLISVEDEKNQVNQDITIRYLLRNKADPTATAMYILGGYTKVGMTITDTITNPANTIWRAGGSNIVSYSAGWDLFTIGMGAIVPLGPRWGVRGHVALGPGRFNFTRIDTGENIRTSGYGTQMIGTVYANLGAGFSLQGGVKSNVSLLGRRRKACTTTRWALSPCSVTHIDFDTQRAYVKT